MRMLQYIFFLLYFCNALPAKASYEEDLRQSPSSSQTIQGLPSSGASTKKHPLIRVFLISMASSICFIGGLCLLVVYVRAPHIDHLIYRSECEVSRLKEGLEAPLFIFGKMKCVVKDRPNMHRRSGFGEYSENDIHSAFRVTGKRSAPPEFRRGLDLADNMLRKIALKQMEQREIRIIKLGKQIVMEKPQREEIEKEEAKCRQKMMKKEKEDNHDTIFELNEKTLIKLEVKKR